MDFKQATSTMACIIMDHSLEVLPGQTVFISGPCDAEPLILACYEEGLRRGAHPWLKMSPLQADYIFYRSANADQLDFLSPLDLAILDKSDKLLFIRTESNTILLEYTDSALIARRRAAVGQTHELIRHKRWCATFYPSEALATRAGLSVADFSKIYFSAVNRPWAELALHDAALADRLTNAHEIRIEAKDTELSFSVSGRKALVGGGYYNLPDGEVYTSPVEDSVEGWITFDLPVDFEGHPIVDATLHFTGGKVTYADAKIGSQTLRAILEADEGAKRLGEFAIGTNFDLSQTLGHIALDEKLGATCHLALGFSPPGTGGQNRSNIHFDLLCDLRKEGRIWADNKPILDSGRLKY